MGSLQELALDELLNLLYGGKGKKSKANSKETKKAITAQQEAAQKKNNIIIKDAKKNKKCKGLSDADCKRLVKTGTVQGLRPDGSPGSRKKKDMRGSSGDKSNKIKAQEQNQKRNEDLRKKYGCKEGKAGKNCLKKARIKEGLVTSQSGNKGMISEVMDADDFDSPKNIRRQSASERLGNVTERTREATASMSEAKDAIRRVTGFQSITKLVLMIVIAIWIASLWWNPRVAQFRHFIENNDLYNFIWHIFIGIIYFFIYKRLFCKSRSFWRCNPCKDDEVGHEYG